MVSQWTCRGPEGDPLGSNRTGGGGRQGQASGTMVGSSGFVLSMLGCHRRGSQGADRQSSGVCLVTAGQSPRSQPVPGPRPSHGAWALWNVRWAVTGGARGRGVTGRGARLFAGGLFPPAGAPGPQPLAYSRVRGGVKIQGRSGDCRAAPILDPPPSLQSDPPRLFRGQAVSRWPRAPLPLGWPGICFDRQKEAGEMKSSLNLGLRGRGDGPPCLAFATGGLGEPAGHRDKAGPLMPARARATQEPSPKW